MKIHRTVIKGGNVMASKYPEIKKYLIFQIESGAFQEGENLPTEKVLTEKFEVSRMTVRRAFDEVIQEGYAHRKRGSSVVVSRHKNEISVNKVIFRDEDALIQKYGKIHYEVVAFEKLKVNHQCMHYLNLAADEEVYQLRRIRRAGNTILTFEDLYFPKKYFSPLKGRDTKLFVNELFEKYCTITGKDSRTQIIEAKNASTFESRLLHLVSGGVTLHVTNVGEKDGVPFFLGIDTLDGNMFKYTSHITED